MTEQDTFNRLSRPSFDDIIMLMVLKNTQEYRKWFIYDIATDSRIEPDWSYWNDIATGWTWKEFVNECQTRLIDDTQPF